MRTRRCSWKWNPSHCLGASNVLRGRYTLHTHWTALDLWAACTWAWPSGSSLGARTIKDTGVQRGAVSNITEQNCFFFLGSPLPRGLTSLSPCILCCSSILDLCSSHPQFSSLDYIPSVNLGLVNSIHTPGTLVSIDLSCSVLICYALIQGRDTIATGEVVFGITSHFSLRSVP
uniref:Uncharacterized protein n=1 Tax=Aegilops tauschii subsp. strangulata TaxID=200361 RepID=A0A453NSN9_AEGTS